MGDEDDVLRTSLQRLHEYVSTATPSSNPAASSSSESSPNASTVTTEEFTKALDEVVHAMKWETWDKLEKSTEVKKGNHKITKKHLPDDSEHIATFQKTAQYGRAMPAFIIQAIEDLNIKPNDSFFDIGSGIGTVVFQVAATVGCKSQGVEVMLGRHQIAEKILAGLLTKGIPLADVTLLFGSFTAHETFNKAKECTVLFVNNANGVFSDRSNAGGKSTDSYVEKLACALKPGSRMLTFDALHHLEGNHVRQCFIVEAKRSAPGAVTWTNTSLKRTPYYIYTKTSDTWTCGTCNMSIDLLDARGEIQDECTSCGAHVYNTRKGSSIKSGHKQDAASAPDSHRDKRAKESAASTSSSSSAAPRAESGTGDTPAEAVDLTDEIDDENSAEEELVEVVIISDEDED